MLLLSFIFWMTFYEWYIMIYVIYNITKLKLGLIAKYLSVELRQYLLTFLLHYGNNCKLLRYNLLYIDLFCLFSFQWKHLHIVCWWLNAINSDLYHIKTAIFNYLIYEFITIYFVAYIGCIEFRWYVHANLVVVKLCYLLSFY